MRILFVSGTAIGGSAHSTRELAERLVARGHQVAILFRVDAPRTRYVHKRAVNLVVKLGSSPLARPVDRAAALVGRRPRRASEATAYAVWDTSVPENSIGALLRDFGPDVVVASSIGRVAWRRIRMILRERGIPSVLYIREESALGHLTISQAPPDLLLANAHTYADRAADLGHEAVVVPSVVTVDRYLVESSRARVLFVNPVPSYGLDAALGLAAARPDVDFAFVEWWKLDDVARAELTRRLVTLPNVVLRPATTDPARIYADGRVLLAPFLLDGRPRVVLEAQANGIPVLGSDLPALRETVGPGGRLVPADAPAAVWAGALGELIDDPERYRRVCEAARAHARREEVDPDAIVTRFERSLADLVAGRPDAVTTVSSPVLSVVVPARDAAATIDAQLEALLAEDWAQPWELVVVDNGSRDATRTIVGRYAARDRRVRLVDASDRAGVAHCRNVGLGAARAAAIAMCDADDVVGRGWVAAMGSALAEHDFVTGPLDVDELNPAWVAGVRGRAIESGPGDFHGVFPFAHSCNLGVRKAVVDRCGGFDERLDTGEDVELSFRIWRAGLPLTFVPDAVVHYRYRATLGDLWAQARHHARVGPWLERHVRAEGVGVPATHEWRRWLWLARHCGLLGSRAGRAHWVSVAGGRVGRLEGHWQARREAH